MSRSLSAAESIRDTAAAASQRTCLVDPALKLWINIGSGADPENLGKNIPRRAPVLGLRSVTRENG